MFLCFGVLRITILLSSLFLYFWVIRCSVGATYTVAFSFPVLCRLFTFLGLLKLDYAVNIFMMLSLSPQGHDI